MGVKDFFSDIRFKSELCLRVLLLTSLVGASSTAFAQPLSLDTMGIFFVGGVRTDSPYSDDRNAQFPTSDRSTVSNQAKITFHGTRISIFLLTVGLVGRKGRPVR